MRTTGRPHEVVDASLNPSDHGESDSLQTTSDSLPPTTTIPSHTKDSQAISQATSIKAPTSSTSIPRQATGTNAGVPRAAISSSPPRNIPTFQNISIAAKSSSSIASSNMISPAWSSAQPSLANSPQTVDSLKEAFNSHLIQSQLKTRKKSRLDRQVLQDSPPTQSPTTSITPTMNNDGQKSVTAKSVSSETTPKVSTPSYPFPNMGHRISFSMSPTGFGPQDRTLPSGTVTPQSVAFLPPGTNTATPCENSDFPSPNLYELALLLYSEPGLDAFWSNLVTIMREYFRAERVSLALPTDLTDLENTPWGQKASFNEADDDDLSLTYMEENEGPFGGFYRNPVSHESHEGSRPQLIKMDSEISDGMRSLNIESDASGVFSPVTVEFERNTALGTDSTQWADAQEFLEESNHQVNENTSSFVDASEDGMQGKVFQTLQPLSYEAEALIDDSGINRVLERGKTVVLSREYTDIQTKWERIAAEREAKARLKREQALAQVSAELVQTPSMMTPGPGGPINNTDKPRLGRSQSQRKRFPFSTTDDFQLRFNKRAKSPSRGASYEEFEQAPSSPWSQSPAPSPAIRQDPSENPFFTLPKVDEDSFNPTIRSPEYSSTEQVHAIGMESATTVIHIPLVHPSSMKSNLSNGPKSTSSSNDIKEIDSKAPIAILSILSSVIPFPSNLVHSLTHLAPFIATAFASSQAFTNAAMQLNHFQYRHTRSFTGRSSMRDSPMGRDSSIISLTSPSECTKSSPSNSLVTTPNVDQGPSSFSSTQQNQDQRSPANSPLPSTMPGDSYFTSRQRKMETKRRLNSTTPSGAIATDPNQNSSSPLKSTFPKQSTRFVSDEVGNRMLSRPTMSRMISEVMSTSSDNKPMIESNIETKDEPKEVDASNSTSKATFDRKGPQSSFNGVKASILKLDLSTYRNQMENWSRSDNLPLTTPMVVPLPSSVPATPFLVPLPPTPILPSGAKAHEPFYKDGGAWTTFGYDDSSPSNRSIAPVKITFPAPKEEDILNDNALPTPFIPSANNDLQTVQTVLEAVSEQASEKTITTFPKVESSKPPKTVNKRQGISRRHSSDQTIYQHTRLHSYGADFGVSFQSAATTDSHVRATTSMSGKNSKYDRTHDIPQSYMPPPSNKLLRTIIDAIPVHVFTAAPQTGDITWVNSRMLSYRGSTAQEFMKDPYQPIHPDDKENYIRLWMLAIRKGEPFSHQMRVKRFDGNYRWFMTRAVPLRDNRGIIVHWFGTNMDIHDQRLAELNATRQAEMAESESKYRSLANSSPQIVFAATASMGITFANNQWLEYSGQTLEEALQLGFMEAVHPTDRHKCLLPGFTAEKIKSHTADNGQGAWFSPISKTKGSTLPNDPAQSKLEYTTTSKDTKDSAEPPFSTELRLKDHHGDYKWHLVRCVSVEANVEGLWFGTCTDINNHKLLEQKLKEANEAAQKSMESKTRFLSNMSHEIRTPLIGISGMVNFLLDTPLNGEQLDYCHTISSSSDGLLMVINDILDLSKVEAGMMRLTSEWFRVRSLVEDANELLSTMAISKELELNYLVEEDVPENVSGDRIRLRQVILNVVGNAIKFTSKGEVFTRCYVVKDAKVDDNQVMLGFECHDTGPGFDKKEEELMFKPFSQIDGSSTRAHGGSGLGLVISRQLVELHGGKMTATSDKGIGSTFFFTAKCLLPTSNETTSSTMTIDERIKAQTGPPSIKSRQSDSSVLTTPSLVHSEVSTSASDSPASFVSSNSIDMYKANLPLRPIQDPNTMEFALPPDVRQKALDRVGSPPASPVTKRTSIDLAVGRALTPPMFSILVVSSQKYSRIAISHHIKTILPKTIPNQITIANEFDECKNLVAGDDPVVFTHIVVNLQDVKEIVFLVSKVLNSAMHSITTLVILTTPMQRTAIIESDLDMFDKMGGKVQFIYKPIKPSRLGVIFDPTKERDASKDRYRHTAQQVVESQKAVFSDMEKEVGNKGHRVLLVEDNPVNQKVLLRFLGRVGMDVETASDGEECVQKVLNAKPGYYGLILCDLHMPRKDGFAACTEIRTWEKKNKSPTTPIIALSANVMSDVAERCAAAGFSRYVSKPVDFKVLGGTIKDLLDPSKDHSLMRQQTYIPTSKS